MIPTCIRHDKKENIATLYITDFQRLLASLVGQNLSLDAQVTSGLGEWESGSVFSIICELVDPCTERDPLANRLTNWPITYFAGGS